MVYRKLLFLSDYQISFINEQNLKDDVEAGIQFEGKCRGVHGPKEQINFHNYI